MSSDMSAEYAEREIVLGDADMLDTIFRFLDPGSVKTVRAVSRLVSRSEY